MNKVKFMKHFVTDGETKAKVYYTIDNNVSNKPCVTLYAKEYGYDLNKIFPNAENDTDSQVDYFEKSRVRFFEDSPYYLDAKKAAIQAKEAWDKHYNKMLEKHPKIVRVNR